MKKGRIYSPQNRASEMDFDDLYREISNGWQDKARKLQSRRWRALERSMREDHDDYAS